MISEAFTPVSAAVGGVLIGAGAALYLFTHGRVAGISGIYGKVLTGSRSDEGGRATPLAFLFGLTLVGLVAALLRRSSIGWTPTLSAAIVAGLLVGVGTHLANGCTSGHGVCGIGRLSVRSIVATCVFMTVAIATVLLVPGSVFP